MMCRPAALAWTITMILQVSSSIGLSNVALAKIISLAPR